MTFKHRTGALVPAETVSGSPELMLSAPPIEASERRESGLISALTWHSLQRWWKYSVIVGVLLATGAAAVVWYRFVPLYRAEAWLRIGSQAPYLAFIDQTGQQTDMFLRTQVELIRSPAVMEGVARHEKVKKLGLPAEYLAQLVQITQRGESEVFQVQFDSETAQSAADVVNAVVDVYAGNQLTAAQQRADRMIELLENDKRRRATELENARNEVRAMAEKHPELVTAAQRLSDERPTATWQARLIDTEVEREVLEAQIEIMRESLSENQFVITPEMVERALDQKPQLRRLIELVSEQEMTLSQTKAVSAHADAEPMVRQLENELTVHRKKLEEMRQMLTPGVEDLLRKELAATKRQEIAVAESEINRLVALEKRLKELIARMPVDENGNGINHKLLEFTFLQSELSRAETVFQQIAARAEALRTESRAPTHVEVIRRAEVPPAPLAKIPALKMGAAGVAGFLLPFFLAVRFERRLRRIVESQQLHHELDLAVVGEIACIPHGPQHTARNGSVRLSRQRNALNESIDSVCTRLLLSRDLDKLQVIVTASAVSSEGKTSLATHLALNLSRSSSQPVLLIDADLRAPAVHKRFEIENQRGLTEVLQGDAQVDEAIVTSWSKNLHILPAGRLKQNPCVLFRNGVFDQLIDLLRKKYHHIVVDVAPVLSASESLVVARAADATLICARRGVSCGPQVRMAYEHLLRAGANPIGAVLIGLPVRNYERTYGAYRYAQHYSSDANLSGKVPEGLLLPPEPYAS